MVQGGAEVAIELSQSKFDMIVFTGSPEKGKLVGRSASMNLVPCILELGGKCPLIVDSSLTNLDFWTRKLLASRFSNAGQICVAID
mmetsp:Transcript_6448/g.13747  ORF Transcript_6448/g.13747 Transcript_6448/m.13747 type:complete len:86 (-) Transcript_6448:789-1046(-)